MSLRIVALPEPVVTGVPPFTATTPPTPTTRIYGLPTLMVCDPNYFEQELRQSALRYIEVFLKPEAKVLPPPVCTILASFLFSHAMIWDYASTSRVRLRMNRIRFEQLYEKVGSIFIPDDSIQYIYDDFFGDSSETEWLD